MVRVGVPVSGRPGRCPVHQPGQWSILEPRVSGTRGGEAQTCSSRVLWGGQAQIQWVDAWGSPGWEGVGSPLRLGCSGALIPAFTQQHRQKQKQPQVGRSAAPVQAASGAPQGLGLATGTWRDLMGHFRRSGVSGPESRFIKIPAKPGDKPQSVGFYCLISELSASGSV